CRGRFDLYVAPGDATARTGKILSTRKDVPMDADRFDRVSKLFAKPRLSRRAALAASAAGLGSVALRPLTGAQEATPVPSVPTEEEGPAFLFVQLAERGSWTPKPDEPGVYLL